jgi:hypothetical protein
MIRSNQLINNNNQSTINNVTGRNRKVKNFESPIFNKG